MIPAPSEEQSRFLDAVKTDHVLADCVAGAGKTTTVLLIARAFPESQILQVTYNSQLKSEVREKAQDAGLQNLEIHTYHSLAVSYYTRAGYDDIMVANVVRQNRSPIRPIRPFSIVVFDEAQDMTDIYFRLAQKFLFDMGGAPRIVVIGDRYQGIYGFKGADTRFLTLAPSLWKWSEFCPLTLSTSYRITHPIASFVNQNMLGYDRLQAVRDGPPVQYVTCNTFTVSRWLSEKLVSMIQGGVCKPDDIFILAGSIKSQQSPLRRLENCLVEAGIPCYFPTSDDRVPDDDVVENKVVFSTFHQAKGRERSVVVVFGFDASYFKYYAREADSNMCPETLYVAATRARNHLMLVQDVQAGPLKFLHNIRQSPHLDLYTISADGKRAKPTQSLMRQTTLFGTLPIESHTEAVTSMTRFLGESSLNHLHAIVGEIFEEECGETYNVPVCGKVMSDVGCEDVSDINGIVIPAMYEAQHCCPKYGKSTIEIDVEHKYDDLTKSNKHVFLQTACKNVLSRVESVEDYLRLGVVYASITEQVYNRIQQIDRYDWLRVEDAHACFEALRPHIDEKTIFEQSVDMDAMMFQEFGRVRLVGRMDAVNEDCIWEIKCVNELTVEHFLQVVLYAWIWRHTFSTRFGSREFRIVNIRTGQIFRLQTGSHLIEEAVYLLFLNKWKKRPVLSDEEFLEKCLSDSVPATPSPSLSRSSSVSSVGSGSSVGCCIIEDDSG